MTIHLKIVLPAAPWMRSMTGLPQVRQPWGKVNAYVRSPVRIRKSSMFLRTRAQFFHSNIRITTPKGPPPYRGGVVCVFQWPVELCRLGLWLLVGPHMPKRSKDRDQPKCGLLVGGHFTPHPPGRVEPDISSLWMDLFSLDSVIFVVDFSDTYLMTNAENSVLELPNFKIFWGGYPHNPLQGSALEIMSPLPSPPLITKNLATALAVPHNRKWTP